MNLHHTKHHQAYVNGLNAAEQAYAQAPSPKERIKLQATLKFNGGGTSPPYLPLLPSRISLRPHQPHSILEEPCPNIRWWGSIPRRCSQVCHREGFRFRAGSVDILPPKSVSSYLFPRPAFKEKMNAKTAAIQGSGWGWLGHNPETSKLEIVTTANQDPLLCMSLRSPISR